MKTRIKVDSIVVRGEKQEWFTPQYTHGSWLLWGPWYPIRDLPPDDEERLVAKFERGTLEHAKAVIDYAIADYTESKAIHDSKKISYITYP